MCFPSLIDQHVSVNTRSFHVPVILWDTHIIKQEGEHVQAFRMMGEEVNNPPFLLDVRLWVRFKRMDHVREFHSITDKKDGEIVSHKIKITLHSHDKKVSVRTYQQVGELTS